jgi:hypothetical protein
MFKISKEISCKYFIGQKNLYIFLTATTALRDEQNGTWFVQAITIVVENAFEEMSLLDFLTRVQYDICEKGRCDNKACGQTPQLQCFPSNKMTICSRFQDPTEVQQR